MSDQAIQVLFVDFKVSVFVRGPLNERALTIQRGSGSETQKGQPNGT